MIHIRQVSVGTRAQDLVNESDSWSQPEYAEPWTMHLHIRSTWQSLSPKSHRTDAQCHTRHLGSLSQPISLHPLTIGDEGPSLGLEEQVDENDLEYYTN